MKEFDDSIFEALFRQAVIDDYNEEIDAIPPKEKLVEIQYFSMEFEIRMKKLLASERRKDFLKRAFQYGKRVAAILAITTALVFGLLLTKPEVRAAVKNAVVEWYDKFTSFIFRAEASDTDEEREWQPDYLPIGYRQSSVERLGRTANIEYLNDTEDGIYLSYRPGSDGTNVSVDNENHVLMEDTVNGHYCYLVKAKEDDFENGVIWSMEGYTFSIWSKLSVDELLKIARSID